MTLLATILATQLLSGCLTMNQMLSIVIERPDGPRVSMLLP